MLKKGIGKDKAADYTCNGLTNSFTPNTQHPNSNIPQAKRNMSTAIPNRFQPSSISTCTISSDIVSPFAKQPRLGLGYE